MNSVKKDKINFYIVDMNEILVFIVVLNDSIEKSIKELKNLKSILLNLKLIEIIIEYLEWVLDCESEMFVFLKLVIDLIENNYFKIRDKVGSKIDKVNFVRFIY